MIKDSPLRKCHEAYTMDRSERGTDDETAAHRPGAARGSRESHLSVEYLQYGQIGAPGAAAVAVPATFGEFEAEYAALRSTAGVMDAPHRGVLAITGADRLDFLDRIVTQDLGELKPGTACESFILNRKGRIDGDLLLVELGDRMLVESDLHQMEVIAAALDEHLFTEDVTIQDASSQHHQIAIHGPGAIDLLQAARDCGGVNSPRPFEAMVIEIGSAEVVVVRRDQVGDPGLSLIIPLQRAEDVWNALLEAAAGKGRPAGWYAFNTARIEAGTSLFNLDFGSMNLPHETGVIDRRVSFKKGCYPGQEIVARTENLGRPRQILRGLRPPGDAVPVTGEAVFAGDESGEPDSQVGIITSSTPSPMLGFAPIAFAMLKSAAAEIGSAVLAYAEGEIVQAKVQDLVFWTRAGAAG